MVGMYEDIVNVDETVEINGYPFYPSEITGGEPFNRREVNRESILGGTEHVSRTKYIVREFSFSTYIHIPDGHPEAYDAIFQEMVNKPAVVISPYMGGKFNAEVTITRDAEESTPNDLKLDVDIKEIPDEKSNISGEVFYELEDEIVG